MRKIDMIVIHCSQSPEGRADTMDDIRRWHTSAPNHWDDVGYHYVVELDGLIRIGRPVNIQGAHERSVNARSIGICYIGGVSNKRDADGEYTDEKDTRTDEQKDAMDSLIKDLVDTLPIERIVGHRDLKASTFCPSFDAAGEYCDFIDND